MVVHGPPNSEKICFESKHHTHNLLHVEHRFIDLGSFDSIFLVLE